MIPFETTIEKLKSFTRPSVFHQSFSQELPYLRLSKTTDDPQTFKKISTNQSLKTSNSNLTLVLILKIYASS